ncbi:hypothetical protein AAFF_G00330370 [Aldrovandia affinis]|uniref:Aftiphilin clathrin-binding box domain-containing protein n=1 Tax=Aldrovandia affinis TaxID=143900 RepID=A0AAD7WPY1_9TELE|nr:hypothetical protein AAFF_G00330370 [Aldrovandia affinis]
MEPDFIHMYSSSPPPLDDAAEEDNEEFGDFGGFSGVTSSLSFSEYDTPKALGQIRAADTLPPGHYNNAPAVGLALDFTPRDPGRGSDHDPSCSHISSLAERTIEGECVRRPAVQATESGGRGSGLSWAHGCNGDFAEGEVLINGFGADESPKRRGPACKPTLDRSPPSPVTDPPQTGVPEYCSQGPGAREHANGLHEGKQLAHASSELHSETGLTNKNGVGDDTHSTGSTSPTVAPGGLSNGVRGSYVGEESEHSDPDPWTAHSGSHQDWTPAAQNSVEGVRPEEQGSWDERVISPCCRKVGDGQAGGEEQGMRDESALGPGEVSASVSDDFASFCQAVSPDELEDFGDFSVTGFALPQPADENEGFGILGQLGPGTLNVFANFATGPSSKTTDEGKFGIFSVPKDGESGKEGEDSQGDFADFPVSDSFTDFSLAPVGVESDGISEWNAFGQPEEGGRTDGRSWAAFREEQSSDKSKEKCPDTSATTITVPPADSPQTCRRDSLSASSLASRLERLFRASFPEVHVLEAGEEVPSLKVLLEPSLDRPTERREERSAASHRELRDVWSQLQDIHDAFGLRYQWGGSHSNKTLLWSLGIDTRSVLFTGQKKQAVIVPMFAASLGMLEPTKEPVKPLSVAEKIASIAQTPPVSPETSTSPDPTQQEALPPVQFDWSSSGLTNPLDGVDPELYELTTAKLETSSRVSDAFTRLMSTAEKTSTSARKPKPRCEENLSEEAAKVITALPDLSFMQAKVLMFPAMLAP